MNLVKSTLIIATGALILGTSCRKKEPVEDAKIGGCLDKDSPLYNANSDFDDESCKFAYTDKYEITYHPEKDGGSNWDFALGNATRADLILRIKEQGSPNWMFQSAVIDDQPHNVPAIWTAPSKLKLYNKTYEWELYDYDATSADDFVSGGTFNAVELAASGTIITKGVNTHGDESQLKIYYTLGD